MNKVIINGVYYVPIEVREEELRKAKCDECKKETNNLRTHLTGWISMGMPEGDFCSDCILGHFGQ